MSMELYVFDRKWNLRPACLLAAAVSRVRQTVLGPVCNRVALVSSIPKKGGSTVLP